jgi:GNAT superfamily N-acetyltransferase
LLDYLASEHYQRAITGFGDTGEVIVEDDRIIAFWNAYIGATQKHSFRRDDRVWESSVVLEVSIWQRSIRLSGIQSIYPRQGNGSRCLKWLVGLARDHGLRVSGVIKRYGTNPAYMSTPEIRAWYKRHGAKHSRGSFLFK